MSTALHVLNGDATLHGFENTGIEGDVLVWREVLSEGPLTKNIASASFWHQRSAFICKTFNETLQHYQDTMVAQLEKYSQPYNEVNLWFEYDLHCQVNMLGALTLLSQQTNLSAPSIFLICPAAYPGLPDFRGMGELNGEQLEYLYDNVRVQLSEYDLKLAAEAWGLYIDNNAAQLLQWLNTTQFWGNMPCLKPAMEAHLKRLQLNAAGLNYIHQKLLDIYNSGARSRRDIYTTFWAGEKIYGMGDSELDIYLNDLSARALISL